jgi:hypothetical protein
VPQNQKLGDETSPGEETAPGERDESEGNWQTQAFTQLSDVERAQWVLEQLEGHKEIFAEHEGAERRQAVEQIEKFSQRVILMLFGLNAGAIALIITLIGNIQSEVTPWSQLVQLFKFSFYAFSAGLILAVLAPTFGYFNANYLRNYRYDPGGLFTWLREDEERL